MNGISKIDDTAGDFVILCDYGTEGIAVVQQCPTAESAAKWVMLNNGGSPLAVVKLVDFSITTENAELCQPCPPSTPPRQETADGQGLA